MLRKIIIQLVIGLLIALPLLGVVAKDVSAASTRVAVIKEMKGTVKVKKAGGSKEFTAFAKMSLNEGDILSTGASSSASLQFANGTSEDDKMVVSANTTLTFSKLKNGKGTSTKVSMFNGSVWVDVKSIASKDDEFSLETPTAVMGVRGTHLLVTVDPNTGATHLTVAAGVVNASSKDANGSNANSKDVYPTQNALFTENKEGDSEITIAPVDLELLMKQSDTSIVQAILENAAAILAENERYVEQYEKNGVPENLGDTKEDLARFKSNTSNLIGAIADQAVKSGLLTQERLDQIIEEVHIQSGITVDLSKKELQLTDEEQKQQEAQRLKDEEANKLADDRKQQEEADRKKQEETLKKLNDERKVKEEANKKALEEQRKKAQEEYQKQLADAEKARYEAEKKKREEEASASSTPSPSPSTSPAPSQGPTKSENANLSALTISYEVAGDSPSPMELSFVASTTTYTATVPHNATQLKVNPTVVDLGKATVKVNGSIPSNGVATVALGDAGTSTLVTILVTAESGATKEYKVTVQRGAHLVSNVVIDFPGVVFDPDIPTYTLSEVSNATQNLSLTFGAPGSNLNVSVRNNDVPIAGVAPGVAFTVPLNVGNNAIVVTLSSSSQQVALLSNNVLFGAIAGSTQTYTFNVKRMVSDDAGLSSVKVGKESVSLTGIDSYNATVPFGTSEVLLIAIAMKISEGATVVVKRSNDTVNTNELVNLAIGTNVFTIIVTAPNQTNTKTYTLTITRSASGDTSLSTVKVGGVTLTTADNTYSTELPRNTTSTTIIAIATKSTDGATVVVKKGNDTVNISNSVSLAAGENLFTITVTAPDLTSKEYNLYVMVLLNHAPTAASAEVTMNQDGVFTGQLAGHDSDASDTLTYALVSAPAAGTLELNSDGSYTYTPAAGSYGAFSFMYKVNDGTLDSDTATVTINILQPEQWPVGIQSFSASVGGTETKWAQVENYQVYTDQGYRYRYYTILPAGEIPLDWVTQFRDVSNLEFTIDGVAKEVTGANNAIGQLNLTPGYHFIKAQYDHYDGYEATIHYSVEWVVFVGSVSDLESSSYKDYSQLASSGGLTMNVEGYEGSIALNPADVNKYTATVDSNTGWVALQVVAKDTNSIVEVWLNGEQSYNYGGYHLSNLHTGWNAINVIVKDPTGLIGTTYTIYLWREGTLEILDSSTSTIIGTYVFGPETAALTDLTLPTGVTSIVLHPLFGEDTETVLNYRLDNSNIYGNLFNGNNSHPILVGGNTNSLSL
jgi:VCBS repeat-containing protein